MHIRKIILFPVLLLAVAVLAFQYSEQIKSFWGQYHFTDSEQLALYLRSYGAMTVVVSLLLMVLQTLCTPLPLFLLAGANGFIFGLGSGIVITFTGSILGATIAFYLARGFGRGIIFRCLKQKYMAKVDQMSRHEGPWMVFMARLIPVIPSSIISYVAGLSKMTYRGFFIATAVGKLPEIVIYTALGHSITLAEGMATKVTILLVVLTIMAWPIISKKIKHKAPTIATKPIMTPPQKFPPGE